MDKSPNLQISIQELANSYLAGKSVCVISRETNIHPQTIYNRFHKAHIPMRSHLHRTVKANSYSEHWKANRMFSNRVNHSAGYIRIKKQDHPRAGKDKYVYEHILVWEKTHNAYLPKDYCVHHINGIKGDNRPQNLVAIKKSQHDTNAQLHIAQQKIRELEAKVKLFEQPG